MITQKELEEMIKKRSDALDYAIAHFEELKQSSDNAEIIKYGTSNYGIGALTPMVKRAFCKGEYGRFLNAAPDKSKYTIYELTAQKKPLRIRHFMSDPRFAANSETFYFFEFENNLWAAPFFSESKKVYIGADCYCFVYENELLKYYGQIDTHGRHAYLLELDNTNYPHVHLYYHHYNHFFFYFKNTGLTDNKVQYFIYEYEYNEGKRGKIENFDSIRETRPEFDKNYPPDNVLAGGYCYPELKDACGQISN